MSVNTLAISRDLTASGLPEKAAEVIAEAFATHIGDNLATKAELSEAKKEIKADTTRSKDGLRGDIAEVKAELKAEVAEVKAEVAEVKAEINSIKTAIVRLEADSRITFWLASAAFVANLGTLAIAVSILLKLTSAA